MARIDGSVSIEGDENVTFHQGTRFVLLVDAVPLVFNDMDTALTWFEETHRAMVKTAMEEKPHA